MTRTYFVFLTDLALSWLITPDSGSPSVRCSGLRCGTLFVHAARPQPPVRPRQARSLARRHSPQAGGDDAKAYLRVGPVNIHDSVLREMDRPGSNHRDPWFAPFFAKVLEDSKYIFSTKKASTVIYPGTGTGGWEASLQNTLSPGDKVVTFRYGQFSHLWVDQMQVSALAKTHLSRASAVVPAACEWLAWCPQVSAQVLKAR